MHIWKAAVQSSDQQPGKEKTCGERTEELYKSNNSEHILNVISARMLSLTHHQKSYSTGLNNKKAESRVSGSRLLMLAA